MGQAGGFLQTLHSKIQLFPKLSRPSSSKIKFDRLYRLKICHMSCIHTVYTHYFTVQMSKYCHFWITMYIQTTHSHSVKLSLNLAGYSERACKPWLFYLAESKFTNSERPQLNSFYFIFYQLSRFQKGQIIHLTPPHPNFYIFFFFKSETFKDCRNPGLVSWK